MAERARWILWTPIWLGLGIGIYFSLRVEPPAWLGVALCTAAIASAWLVRGRAALVVATIPIVLATGGFTLAQWRTLGADHVILERKLTAVTVSGRVSALERLPAGARVVLDKTRISTLEAFETPERVRIRLRGVTDGLEPGVWIQVRARLAPPPPPAMPGSYDFQFLSYFDEIGATGFALSHARVIDAGSARSDLGSELAQNWQSFRNDVSDRIRDAVGGPEGAIAAALVTGDRAAIPEEINEAYRNSGIYHLLSISGMHIGLVAGLLFALVRAALALVPYIALRYPIKKWAAGTAIAGAFFYTLLAGATVPTVRSFVMMGLVLAAMIADRKGISMRFVAIAASLILAFHPEALLSASFQMSFAAVVALVAAYEVWGGAFARGKDRGMVRRLWLYIAAVALTTIIATIATAPFSVYHFNRIAIYGLIGNLIAVPLSGLIVMPAAVLGMVLMPLSLEEIGLVPMGWGIELLNIAAREVAALDGAVLTLPAMPPAALVAVVVGGAWICLWRRPWRIGGIAAIALGCVLAARAVPPSIIADGDARLFAFSADDGRMIVSTRTSARFEREVWLRRAGYDLGAEETWNRYAGRGVDGERVFTCDWTGCIWRAGDETIAFTRTRAGLAEDCTRAGVVVSAVPVRGRICPSARLLVDRFDLWREGTHAIWIENDNVRVETVNGVRGLRPWVVWPDRVRATRSMPDDDAEATSSPDADSGDDAPN